MTATDTDLRNALETEARALGFAGFGVTRPDAIRAAGERLGLWADRKSVV